MSILNDFAVFYYIPYHAWPGSLIVCLCCLQFFKIWNSDSVKELFNSHFLNHFLRIRSADSSYFYFLFLLRTVCTRALRIPTTKNLLSKTNVKCQIVPSCCIEGCCIYFFPLLTGYGTIFPKTSGGQMFCVVFATVGIPLTIMLFKYIFILVYLPFEKFGIYLQHKGLNEVNFLSPSAQSHTYIW